MCARAVDTNVPAGAAVQRPPRRSECRPRRASADRFAVLGGDVRPAAALNAADETGSARLDPRGHHTVGVLTEPLRARTHGPRLSIESGVCQIEQTLKLPAC